MWTRWFPWRFIVSRLARARGFTDPVSLLSHLHRFAQPSEVTEPIELLRAGVVFHARGLINTRAIQHNLDWVWPFWIERQFDPTDRAFIPRAFSITHVNLTHRNWTAVGIPDCDWYPVVDPRGLLTPLYDGWSIDAWLLPDYDDPLLPSRSSRCEQTLVLSDPLAVETRTRRDACDLQTRAEMLVVEDRPRCGLRVTGRAPRGGWLAVALRPANPEGASFIHEVRRDRNVLRVNDDALVHFDRPLERVGMSQYRRGDVYQDLPHGPDTAHVKCDVGLASAAALFRLNAGQPLQVTATVEPLDWSKAGGVHARSLDVASGARSPTAPTELDVLAGPARLEIPDPRMQMLFDAAVRNLELFAPASTSDVYPGPYTYKRFWFRDAAFILNGLLAVGMRERVRRVIERFPSRQGGSGYFRSQEGEWDSNGAALWITAEYCRLTGQAVSPRLLRAARRGAEWICRKRVSRAVRAPHAGLLPAGFSAEHLGPNDFYYWDDFFSVAGLRSAAELLRSTGDSAAADRFEHEAAELLGAIDRSIAASAPGRDRSGVPASPYRRMDAGAIGSLAGGYPLRLWSADDPRLLQTVEFLLAHCTVRGGFFQDMIHSGINAYLTLHLAQVLLRARDSRCFDLVRAVAELASPTGQWPEAIHPLTGGGCMGDGQHLWAAAEWVLMMRNCFVLEDPGRLVVGAGIPAAWLEAGTTLRFGPTPTSFGPLLLTLEPSEEGVAVRWRAAWRRGAPALELAVPGFGVRRIAPADVLPEGAVGLRSAAGTAAGVEGRR